VQDGEERPDEELKKIIKWKQMEKRVVRKKYVGRKD
jgi:hypothetical protein